MPHEDFRQHIDREVWTSLLLKVKKRKMAVLHTKLTTRTSQGYFSEEKVSTGKILQSYKCSVNVRKDNNGWVGKAEREASSDAELQKSRRKDRHSLGGSEKHWLTGRKYWEVHKRQTV